MITSSTQYITTVERFCYLAINTPKVWPDAQEEVDTIYSYLACRYGSMDFWHNCGIFVAGNGLR
jgi:hypothetical protein